MWSRQGGNLIFIRAGWRLDAQNRCAGDLKAQVKQVFENLC
jgi:hypothetical protein